MLAQMIPVPMDSHHTLLPLDLTVPDNGTADSETDHSSDHEQQMLLFQAAKGTAELLWELGIPMHLHGYHYLLEAVPLALVTPEMSTNLSHQLYPCIAQHYHTSASCVERSIRNAINLAWKRGTLAAANGMFGRSLNLTYDKPTNSEMIAMLTERIRLKLYEATLHESR